MLDEPSRSNYIVFVLGLPIAIFMQNAFASILHTRRHHNYVTTILKTIFNLSGGGRLIVSFVDIMISPHTQSGKIAFAHSAISFFYRESLAAFLLWRLILITNNVRDKYVALILLLLRTAPQLYGVVADVISNHSTVGNHSILVHDKFATIGFVAVDFVIDVYITVRLAQILGRANRKYSRTVSVPSDGGQTLFTAVLWWNFIRVFVAGLVDALALYTVLTKNLDDVLFNTLQAVVCIAMSYVLTFDADIVRMIRGMTSFDKRPESSSRTRHTSATLVGTGPLLNETPSEVSHGKINDDDLEKNNKYDKESNPSAPTFVGSGAWLPSTVAS
jgi:hypothetical protein